MIQRTNVMKINGVGNAAIDTSRLQAAVAVANAANKPVTFEISGSVYVNAIITITAPVSMRFMPGAELVRTREQAQIKYGTDPTPWLTRSYPVTANSTTSNLPSKSSTLRSSSLQTALGVSLGDLVVVWSDSAITAPDITPQAGYEVRYIPMELHRIERLVTGTTDTWTFADFIDDGMLLNPFIAKINTIRGVRIDGLRARKLPTGQFAAGESASGNFLLFNGCEDLELYDCWFTYPSPGALGYRFCYNVRTVGCRLGALENPNTEIASIYGIVEAICNRTHTSQCTFDAVRHVYTTGSLERHYPWTAGESVVAGDYRLSGTVVIGNTTYYRVWRASAAGVSGSTAPAYTTQAIGGTVSDGSLTWEYRGTSDTVGLYLYGTNRNFKVSGCTASYNGQQTTSTTWTGASLYDTHADALRGVFENNVAIIPAGGSGIAENVGFNIRGRRVTVRGNTVKAHQSTRPCTIHGPNCLVADNVFEGGWRCTIASGTSANPGVSGVRFTGNKFINFLGPGIHIQAGTGIEITHNDFGDVGYLYTNSPLVPSMAVYVETLATGGTVCILNNKMPRDSNRMAVGISNTVAASQVVISGNVVPGYGQYNQGLRHPVWYSGETITAGQLRWANGREYRAATSGTVQATMPTHSVTGFAGNGETPVSWQFVRQVPLATVVELETRYLHQNGWPKYLVLHAPAHGRSAADRHKPLDTNWEPWDDADAASVYSGYILLDALTEDHLLVATKGDILELPGDAVSGSYSITADGRALYWDLSVGKYVSSITAAGNLPVFYAANYTGSAATNYLQVRVL
jgi:hypothetical protein